MAHRYQDTKLFNVLFGRSLTAHLPSTSPLVVDTVNPGFCYSSFRRNVKFPVSLVASLMEVLLARQTDEGAKCLVWGATAGMNDPTLRESLKGAYTSDCKVEEPSDFIFTKEGKNFEQRVWVRGFLPFAVDTTLIWLFLRPRRWISFRRLTPA
jgi:retinol dehydrogenase-12